MLCAAALGLLYSSGRAENKFEGSKMYTQDLNKAETTDISTDFCFCLSIMNSSQLSFLFSYVGVKPDCFFFDMYKKRMESKLYNFMLWKESGSPTSMKVDQ
ncbi:unnamed protein product [Sphenostylis stenocarpa]|uniref:Uncharacterized protein n=1 Tax=Sphenostylis stenocarpa TaxID=92480 RepID=A0AA86S8J8_9FABA|nr:unnamed protein product [Sphenostylis stenocarpa]